MSWRLSRAHGLMVAALFFGLPDAPAAGEQPGSFDRRLMFDPGTLAEGRFILGATGPKSSKAPARASGENAQVAIQGADSEALPELSTDQWSVDVPSVVDRAVPLNPAANDAGSDSRGLDPRLNLGRFSVGVETDTPANPRIPFAGDMNETGYDTSYDPKHPHPLPFVGFSAKSILP